MLMLNFSSVILSFVLSILCIIVCELQHVYSFSCTFTPTYTYQNNGYKLELSSGFFLIQATLFLLPKQVTLTASVKQSSFTVVDPCLAQNNEQSIIIYIIERFR